MNGIHTFGNDITVDIYGGKAYWLNWLYSQKINIPDSLFIPAGSRLELLALEKNDDFKNSLQRELKKTLKSHLYAVRSSAVEEDGFVESKAGNYQSYLNVDSADGVIKAILNMGKSLADGNRLGIIVQKMITPEVSGVIFSSNPKTGNRAEPYLCMTSGVGDELMAGLEKGEELQVKILDDRIEIPEFHEKIARMKVLQIILLAKKLEKKLNFPVDVEWCIEKHSQEIVILQCRPMTGIFVDENRIVPVNCENVSQLPKYLVASDKVWLRELAEKNNFMISNAYLMVCNCQSEIFPEMDFMYKKSEYFRGYSVVLISPSKIDGEVQRFFVGEKKKLYSVTKCHRFGVREVADYSQIESCLNDVYQVARTKQWTCSAIIQEILDAKYTGVVKKITDGYVIEIAKGHFLSKGIIPMSMYVINFDGIITYRNEVWQKKYISIVEGCVLEYRLEEPEKITVPDMCIKNIINVFASLLSGENMIVEFGILNNHFLTPYVIDCMQGNREITSVSLPKIEQGVLSEGKIEGTLVKLDLIDDMNALNFHFYNDIASTGSENKEVNFIFFAKMPNIQLLEILNRYRSEQIGFVFEDGSMLCHFAVLLRERGIPALRGIKGDILIEGETYILDTTDVGLRKG